ncbi:hypothetical protein SEA_C3PO_26 [Corynebacterium phage C3PO]|uniref:Uncharacterized protein n=1 Tax=Corynebacterium phage C3PO TaxID=2047868 RepID=A0A2H4P890_9CAUD|nr:minor tail protein [Corynebacterium phage C3PO]ATW58452.1 hypothetical protein SEA_C3PO_26 [Corynebacterium phage C3PO]
MGINVGSRAISGVFVGSTAVQAVYVGSTKVWPNFDARIVPFRGPITQVAPTTGANFYLQQNISPTTTTTGSTTLSANSRKAFMWAVMEPGHTVTITCSGREAFKLAYSGTTVTASSMPTNNSLLSTSVTADGSVVWVSCQMTPDWSAFKLVLNVYSSAGASLGSSSAGNGGALAGSKVALTAGTATVSGVGSPFFGFVLTSDVWPGLITEANSVLYNAAAESSTTAGTFSIQQIFTGGQIIIGIYGGGTGGAGGTDSFAGADGADGKGLIISPYVSTGLLSPGYGGSGGRGGETNFYADSGLPGGPTTYGEYSTAGSTSRPVINIPGTSVKVPNYVGAGGAGGKSGQGTGSAGSKGGILVAYRWT